MENLLFAFSHGLGNFAVAEGSIFIALGFCIVIGLSRRPRMPLFSDYVCEGDFIVPEELS